MTRNPPPSALSLSVQYAAKPDGAPTRAQLRRWVKAALRQDAEIALRIVDEEEGRALNRDYRGKDYATNVLTFVYDDDFPGAELPLAGDIVLCAPVVAREALQQEKPVEAHYAHLTVHGVLHLQGYDHESDEEARQMEALEIQIVTKLGYADPY
ncbi:MAG: rRNA maturation RNase YbeY [Sulfuricella sp.]|nr:rRNA maturation RNase YbeY [Sulfuricella sp.]